MARYLALLILLVISFASLATPSVVANYAEYYKSKGYSEVNSNELGMVAVLYNELQTFELTNTELDVISIYADNIMRMSDVWGSVTGARKAAILTVMISIGEDFYKLESFIMALKEKDYTRAKQELVNTLWCSNYGKACNTIADTIESGSL